MTTPNRLALPVYRMEGTKSNVGELYWRDRHDLAYRSPRPGYERGLKLVIDGLAEYAAGHEIANGLKLSQDYVFGESWIVAWSAIRGLLNGGLGRFDGGTLDSRLIKIATAAGFTETQMDMGTLETAE